MIKFTPTKENYLSFDSSHKVRCGRYVVFVSKYHTDSRAGSWERGFKFSYSEWAMLIRASDKKVSLDHGKTWFDNPKLAFRMTKNKMRLKHDSHPELAFEGIQKINRDYYGPDYQWRK